MLRFKLRLFKDWSSDLLQEERRGFTISEKSRKMLSVLQDFGKLELCLSARLIWASSVSVSLVTMHTTGEVLIQFLEDRRKPKAHLYPLDRLGICLVQYPNFIAKLQGFTAREITGSTANRLSWLVSLSRLTMVSHTQLCEESPWYRPSHRRIICWFMCTCCSRIGFWSFGNWCWGCVPHSLYDLNV